MGWRFRIVNRPVDFAAYGSLAGLVEAEQPDVLAYTNADRTHLAGLPSFRGFHVVRDPRDVVVSGYFSHRNSHPTEDWPELVPHREKLQAVSKEEGLSLEMDFSREWLDHMRDWDYTRPDVLELKMEAVTVDPVASFEAIYDFFGILDHAAYGAIRRAFTGLVMKLNVLNQRGRRFTPFHLPLSPFRFSQRRLTPAWVAYVVQRKSFERLSGGRAKGQENVQSHYRKGQPGDWRNHFTPAHTARFAQEFGDLLITLGYEADASWSVECRVSTRAKGD